MVVHNITLHGSWLLHITPNCDGFDPLQPWTHEGMGQVIQTGGCMRVFQVTRVLLRFLVPVYNLTHSHAACVHVQFPQLQLFIFRLIKIARRHNV